MLKLINSNHQAWRTTLIFILAVSFLLAFFSPYAMSEDEFGDDAVESVTLYQHCKYGGKAVSLKTGIYELPALKAMGLRDNDVSSIQVPKGYRVLIFDDPRRFGRPLSLYRSIKCLKGTGYNDKVSAVVIRSLKHATVYQYCFAKGRSVLLSPGRYSRQELQELGVRNDDVSSIRLPPGLEMRLFEHDGFRGRSVVRKKTDLCLDNQNFDNVTSSIVIARKGAFRRLDASYKPDPPHSRDKSDKSRTHVVVYPNCIWRGKKVWLAPGRYTTQMLASMGIQNDDVSSISVPEGLEAKLFESDHFQGHSIIKKKGDACFDNDSFNNIISSIVITRTGSFRPVKKDPAPAVQSPVPQPGGVSFGCGQSWRWVSGSISVESAKSKCDQAASISNWIIKGVAANRLRATGVANDQTGVLMLTVDQAGQKIDLRINNIRSTSVYSSEFRYGVSAESPLIGVGRWERLQH